MLQSSIISDFSKSENTLIKSPRVTKKIDRLEKSSFKDFLRRLKVKEFSLGSVRLIPSKHSRIFEIFIQTNRVFLCVPYGKLKRQLRLEKRTFFFVP